jgi:hypothetical protein
VRFIRKLFVERNLIIDPQANEYGHCHPHRQTGDIDQRMSLALQKVSDGRFEKVPEHKSG